MMTSADEHDHKTLCKKTCSSTATAKPGRSSENLLTSNDLALKAQPSLSSVTVKVVCVAKCKNSIGSKSRPCCPPGCQVYSSMNHELDVVPLRLSAVQQHMCPLPHVTSGRSWYDSLLHAVTCHKRSP